MKGLRILGDIAGAMRAEIAAGERAVRGGVTAAAAGLKAEWRGQIERAGLGSRLARTIRSEVYPKGAPSLNAAGLVWTKAPEIIGAHDTGPLVKSKAGLWLTIPTAAAGRGFRGGRITPGEWERRTGMRLRFVYRRGRPSLLVADNARLTKRGQARANMTRRRDGTSYTRLAGRTTVPIFLLVPQVQLRKRLDLTAAANTWSGRLPGLVGASWRD